MSWTGGEHPGQVIGLQHADAHEAMARVATSTASLLGAWRLCASAATTGRVALIPKAVVAAARADGPTRIGTAQLGIWPSGPAPARYAAPRTGKAAPPNAAINDASAGAC